MDAFILSTVVDGKATDRWLDFVDAPELISVAVSRAQRRFILVTHRSMLPKSRHIRDLIAYISRQNFGAPAEESAVVSVFDLLYRRYSSRLRALQARVRGPSKYRSENLIWTILGDILEGEAFSHLDVYFQYRLSNLFTQGALRRLNDRQRRFVRSTPSVDFLVFRKAGREPILGIDLDGFAFHEDDSKQLARDRIKDDIFAICDLALLRLPTTGSAEDVKIREALEQADGSSAKRTVRAIP